MPNTGDTEFFTAMDEIFKICNKYSTCLFKSHTHKMMGTFITKMYDQRFLPTISKPTRVMHFSSTLIDNIYVKSDPIKHHSSYVVMDSMSDHFPCILLYDLFDTSQSRMKRSLKDVNYMKMLSVRYSKNFSSMTGLW